MHNDIYFLRNKVNRLEKELNRQDWLQTATIVLLLLVSIATVVNAWN